MTMAGTKEKREALVFLLARLCVMHGILFKTHTKKYFKERAQRESERGGSSLSHRRGAQPPKSCLERCTRAPIIH